MGDYKQLVELLRIFADPDFWCTLRQHRIDGNQHYSNVVFLQRDFGHQYYLRHDVIFSEEFLQGLVREANCRVAQCDDDVRKLLKQYEAVRPLLTAIAPAKLGELPFFQTGDQIERIDPPQIAQLMCGILGHVLEKGDAMVSTTLGELTTRFGVDYKTIHRWAAKGQIRLNQDEHKRWWIHRDDLERFNVLEKT